MSTPIDPLSGSNPGSSTPPAAAPKANDFASKDVFLKLLVAQLKHQDPLSPADGLQFVTQLAQFTSLEQSTQMREDLDAILAHLKSQASPPPADGKSTSASNSTTN